MNQEHHGTEVNHGASPPVLESQGAFDDLRSHWVLLKSAEAKIDLEQGGYRSVKSACPESGHLERSQADFTAKRIGVVAKHCDSLIAALAGRQECEHDVLISDNMVGGLHDILNRSDAWVVLFFKYEDFGTITSLFNFMRLFRLRCPTLPLVLVSDNFQRDDFGPERLPLCDASLKLPTSVDNVEAAIEAAHINNGIWVTRTDESERRCATG